MESLKKAIDNNTPKKAALWDIDYMSGVPYPQPVQIIYYRLYGIGKDEFSSLKKANLFAKFHKIS